MSIPNKKNLSALENTPELAVVMKLAHSNWHGEHGFYTTLGHIVTKILDMDITFNLPDGSDFRPFQTVGDVNTFFRIDKSQYARNPNSSVMDFIISEIYRAKVAPREKELLNPQRETMRIFFEQNIWGDISDCDTIDTLLGKIDELSEMGIEEISNQVCNDLKEWIIMNCIGMGRGLEDWYNHTQEERNTHLVEFLDKGKYTDYFVDLTVDAPWKKNPNNPYKHMMNVVQNQIRALYRVDGLLKKNVARSTSSQFRNTRYL